MVQLTRIYTRGGDKGKTSLGTGTRENDGNETGAIKGLYQFDAPSSPEKWERIWSEVEAA